MKGIMSYDWNMTGMWSDCSRTDFIAYYNWLLDGNWQWCMPEAPNVCNAPKYNCPKMDELIANGWDNRLGNGRCDTWLNDAGCLFDGGDCCQKTPEQLGNECGYWDDKCTCLDPQFTTTTTTTITTTTTTTIDLRSKCPTWAQYPSWYRDGFCDPLLNNPECGYDGGDCCISPRGDWDFYCFGNHGPDECKCKGFDCNWHETAPTWGTFGDGECYPWLNNPGCFYDYGDCCENKVTEAAGCKTNEGVCNCEDPFKSVP